MDMKIVEKKEFKIIGMEIETGPFECRKVAPKLWADFMKRVQEIKNKVDEDVHYGAAFVTGECDFRYVVGVEVTNFENIPEGMVKQVVPASRYAVFTHKGSLATLGNTYARLYEDIMPKSGLKQKDFWFELYDKRFNKDKSNSEMDLYIAVE